MKKGFELSVMKKRIGFLVLLFGIFIICLNFASAVAPTFVTIPDNSSLFYGNQSLSATFNATNTSAWVNYFINDTANFTITQIGFNLTNDNQTALLINKTPLAAGNYAVNVTINQSGGLNWTIFLVQVKKANYFDCGVYFNTTTPKTYPTNFIVYTNCSSAYMIYRNGTWISNASTMSGLAAAPYNFSAFRNDTANYTNIYGYTQFIVNPDTTIPTPSEHYVNNTEVYKITNFALKVDDDSSLVPNATLTSGRYIFSTNNTGLWVNDTTLANFTTTPGWANVTKTLNLTVGTMVGYRWYFNDTSFNANSTPIYVVTTTADVTPPTYSGAITSTRIPGRMCDFTITVDDNLILTSNGTTNFDGAYIFSTDNSGHWVNDSAVLLKSTPGSVAAHHALNSTSGKTIHYIWYFNDSAGNKISTTNYSLTTSYSNSGSTGGSHGGGGVVTPPANPTEESEQPDTGNENNANEVAPSVTCPVTSTNENGVCKKTLSNGRVADIKVMPATASEKAIARLGDLGFSVILKEVGTGVSSKPVYELTGKKQGKFLGIFKITANIKAQVDAETGDVKVIKPWWSFLASGL